MVAQLPLLDLNAIEVNVGLTELKFSAKWCQKRVACTLATVPHVCGAGCCTSRAFWPAMSTDRPNGHCHHLGPQGCRLGVARPVTCHLYPLKISKTGTVVLHYRVTQSPNHFPCRGNYGNGPMVIEALADSLDHLFGAVTGQHIVDEVRAGRDVIVPIPDHLRNDLNREMRWAADNDIPAPRDITPYLPEEPTQ